MYSAARLVAGRASGLDFTRKDGKVRSYRVTSPQVRQVAAIVNGVPVTVEALPATATD